MLTKLAPSSLKRVTEKEISPHGNQIAFIHGYRVENMGHLSYDGNIWIIDITGKNKKRLDKNLNIYDGPPVLEWSSDGLKIAYVSFERYYWKGKCYIWLIDVNSGKKELLVTYDALNTGSEFAFVPSITWSPDSSMICVYLYEDRNKNEEWDVNIDSCDLWIIDIKS